MGSIDREQKYTPNSSEQHLKMGIDLLRELVMMNRTRDQFGTPDLDLLMTTARHAENVANYYLQLTKPITQEPK